MKKIRVIGKEPRRGSRKGGNLEAPNCTQGREEAWKAEGMHSETDLQAQRSPVRERWQQTFAIDARQDTIGSGSCCCSPQRGSRSFVGYRTESLDAVAHSKAGRCG